LYGQEKDVLERYVKRYCEEIGALDLGPQEEAASSINNGKNGLQPSAQKALTIRAGGGANTPPGGNRIVISNSRSPPSVENSSPFILANASATAAHTANKRQLRKEDDF
jgi:hypothetical protein